MKSWKTTLAGLSAIIGGITIIVQKGNIIEAVTAITTGIGLIFAKDKNVTGGTVQQ